MNILLETHQRLLSQTKLDFVRSYVHQIQWQQRLVAIMGARGVGKTTLLLQYIKKNFGTSNKVLYASLDHFWFASNSLFSLVDQFAKTGGTHLFIDEVHKYTNWSRELKNIYDSFPELHIVFTGSSMLEIINAQTDLSRRAVQYHMQGLSFREYLQMELNITFDMYSLEDMLTKHNDITSEVLNKVKPLAHFENYLQFGYYPFYKQFSDLYHHQLQAVLRMILEIELPLLRGVDVGHISKIKQLLQIIAASAPFIPNVSGISNKTAINRNTLLRYLHYLNDAGITMNLFRPNHGVSLLQKPEKIFLENPNIYFALIGKGTNKGSLRETFFYNQVKSKHTVHYPEKFDFLIDEQIIIEVGGANKTAKSNPALTNKPIYVASDNIEYGTGNKVPLWLFGFLY
jgi:predicted AAA+ superfamily ATPase